MKIAFDIISDLHLDEWSDFNWELQATSPFCIIAGDTARDRKVLRQGLKHISSQYTHVFVIDGNEEHRYTYNNLTQSYIDLVEFMTTIPNVTYLHNNIVILEGIAIVATCGWYSFNSNPNFSVETTKKGVEEHYGFNRAVSDKIEEMAIDDARYLSNTVEKLQLHMDVKNIIIATHFIPYQSLLEHDEYLMSTWTMNASVNDYAPTCLQGDTEKKVSHWIYGHYHGPTSEKTIGHTKFITNPSGRRSNQWHQNPYFPVRIEF